jgi:hypothetical protein
MNIDRCFFNIRSHVRIVLVAPVSERGVLHGPGVVQTSTSNNPPHTRLLPAHYTSDVSKTILFEKFLLLMISHFRRCAGFLLLSFSHRDYSLNFHDAPASGSSTLLLALQKISVRLGNGGSDIAPLQKLERGPEEGERMSTFSHDFRESMASGFYSLE